MFLTAYSKGVTPMKSVKEIAQEVIAGLWGNGDERRRRLTEAGYDYDVIQQAVNDLLNGNEITEPQPSVTDDGVLEVSVDLNTTRQIRLILKV